MEWKVDETTTRSLEGNTPEKENLGMELTEDRFLQQDWISWILVNIVKYTIMSRTQVAPVICDHGGTIPIWALATADVTGVALKAPHKIRNITLVTHTNENVRRAKIRRFNLPA